MKIKIFHDTRSNLIWAVRIVEKGDKFGVNDCLDNDGKPLVEFYDTRYEHTDLGQFVSRYFLETLAGADGNLVFVHDTPNRTVYEPCMNRIRDWLRRQA